MSAEAVLRFGTLEFRADAITPQGDGTKLLAGHVRVNNVLKFGGDLEVDPLNLIASGSGQVYVDAAVARIILYSGDFSFGILGENGKLTNFLSQSAQQVLALAGLQFKLQNLELLSDGVRVAGTLDLAMGPMDRKTSVLSIDIKTLEATQSNGLRLDGCATVPSLTLKGAIGLKDTKFCLDTFQDVFSGGTMVVTPLIKVGGDFAIRTGQLDRIGITVGGLHVPIGSTGLFLTGGDGAVDHLVQPPVEISLHVDIGGGPDVNGTYVAELRRLGVTVQAPEYFVGSGDLYVFGVKGAGGSIKYIKAGIDAQLDLNLVDVLDATLKAHLTGTQFSGSADGSLQIPDGNGFPLNLVKKVVKLPYKIASTSNTVDQSKIEGTFTLLGPKLPIVGQVQLDLAHRLSYAPPKIKFALGTDLQHLHTLFSFGAMANVMMPASLAATPAGLPLSFPVPDGQRQLILAVHGAGGAPPVLLTAPDGTQMDPLQPTTWSPGRAVWLDNDDPAVSFWVVDHPLGGDWTAFVDNRVRTLDSLVAYGSVDRPQVVLGTPVAGSVISVKWWARSRGRESKLSFYYDTDASGFDGQLIASGIDATAGEGLFTWNLEGVRTGQYYLLARLDDGRNPAVYHYARTPVQVTEAAAPAPPVLKQAGQMGNAIQLEWDPSPSADVLGYAVVYGTGAQGDEFPNLKAFGDTTTATLDSLPPGRTYRCAVYAFTEDGRRSILSDVKLVEFRSTSGNNLPEIFTHPRERSIVGREYRYVVGVRDLDGELPTISLVSGPAAMAVDQQGVVIWTPQTDDPGRHEVAIVATDGHGGQDRQEFTLTVVPEWFGSGRLTLDGKLYIGAGAVATIQVDDLDLDVDPAVIDSVRVAVWSSLAESRRNVTLFETGVGTGAFRGVVLLSSGGGSAPVLSVPSGGLFHARYDDTLPAKACLDSAVWVERLPVPAPIEIHPNTLNLKSSGRFITAYVTLPPPLDPRRIDLREVRLCGQIAAVNKDFGVGDSDGNGLPGRVVKFDREAVESAIRLGAISPSHLWLTGRVYSEVAALDFAGGDSIRTIDRPAPAAALPQASARVEAIRPNPFQRSVEIKLRLEQGTVADVSIFEVSGRRVRTVMSGTWPAGEYTLSWDGRNDAGDSTPAGLYFIRVKTGARESVYRIVRLSQ